MCSIHTYIILWNIIYSTIHCFILFGRAIVSRSIWAYKVIVCTRIKRKTREIIIFEFQQVVLLCSNVVDRYASNRVCPYNLITIFVLMIVQYDCCKRSKWCTKHIFFEIDNKIQNQIKLMFFKHLIHLNYCSMNKNIMNKKKKKMYS